MAQLALDLILGPGFGSLLEVVKVACNQNTRFKSVLKDIQLRLESLKGKADVIQQIEDYSLRLSLGTGDIQILAGKMAEGKLLVEKLSNIRIWNYCCVCAFAAQLEDLKNSLDRLLDNLAIDGYRDMKEILVLLRKFKDDADGQTALLKENNAKILKMEAMLLQLAPKEAAAETSSSRSTTEMVSNGVVQVQMEAMLLPLETKVAAAETSSSRSKTEMVSNGVVQFQMEPMLLPLATKEATAETSSSRSKTEMVSNGVVQVLHSEAGAALRAVFEKLFDVVMQVKVKKMPFRPLLGNLKFMLECLKPFVEEIEVLDFPNDILEELRMQMEDGTKVVRKCSKFGLWAKFTNHDHYTNRLLRLDESLRKHLNRFREQVARKVSEIVESTRSMQMMVEQTEGITGVLRNQIELELELPGEVPEFSSSLVNLEVPEVLETKTVARETSIPGKSIVEEVKLIEGRGGADGGAGRKLKGKSIVEGSQANRRAIKFRPPSPAKHIRAMLARRHRAVKPNKAAKPEGGEAEPTAGLDKSFGFSKNFGNKYELGAEVGRGHFAYACKATFKKGELKGQQAAVKVISKAKMTTAIAIEDVRREVKILKALTGHNNLVKFYDSFEDHANVYIVMELCEGGDLLDRILARGGKYSEDDARTVMIQILNVVSFCHLQGVVHRDLKLENFLFSSKDEDSQLKAIDFGLSDFVKPDERLNDIVGSAYYVAPEVLDRSYGTEADVWSVGVIAYILLCGSRPFWARTESGIFRAVLKADPSLDEAPWPSLSTEARDFVKRLLNKDPRKRMTAAQALCHPWLKNSNDVKVPLDILIFKPMKVYMRSSALRKAALRALSKTLTVDELHYMKEQFALLEPDKNGTISLDNIKTALMKNATDAMKEARISDFLASLNALQYRRMDFEEFCTAALSVHQLEALDRWEQHARCAYELFEKDGNRTIMIEELASELGLGHSVPVHAVLHDGIRHTDGKLSFLGFVKLLQGVSSRAVPKAQ